MFLFGFRPTKELPYTRSDSDHSYDQELPELGEEDTQFCEQAGLGQDLSCNQSTYPDGRYLVYAAVKVIIAMSVIEMDAVQDLLGICLEDRSSSIPPMAFNMRYPLLPSTRML